MSKNMRVEVPVVMQMEATECGAASLAMILAYYKRWIPLEKLRNDCGVSRDGSKASNVLKAARKHGCEAHGYKLPADRLLEQDISFPLIIHWEFNHFVVLEGIKGETVYLNDPAMGRRTVKWSDFRTSYTGISLYIKPGKDFQKSGHRYNIAKTVYEKLKHDKWAVAFVMLLNLGMLVPQLASPVFSQIFLDDILTAKHPDWMFNLCIAMVLSFILSGIMNFLRSWVLTRWQQKLTLSDSASFFWHVVKLPMEFFHQRYAGEIASRVGFAESIAGVLSGSAATAVLDLIVALFFLLLLLQYSVPLTIIGVSFSLIDLAVFFYLRRRLTDMSMRIQQDAGKAYGAAVNGLQMIESIKANGNEADLFTKIAGYHAKVMAASQESTILSQRVHMIPALLASLNGTLIMTVGGYSIMEGVMTAGTFMAFQSLMGNFQAPFNSIIGLGQSLQGTEMQMQRMDDVRLYEVDKLNFPEKEPEYTGNVKLSGKLELRDVYFGYSKLEPPLLQGINITIQPGRWTAVVGASGSGKSTLGKLVTGIYDVWEGQILLDDKDRRELPRKVIVNSLASVDQDVFQISGTIRENISLFDKSISKEDVIEAAKDACIHEDILHLNGGYEAMVIEGGANFSGGQKQRLEIARALAVRPSLLVLDEATSALDPVTEVEIINNIRRRGCACLIIAHRLSTVRDCDEIIVMDNGLIVERGTHDELIKNKGAYYQLIQDRNEEENQDILGGDSL